MLVYFFVQKINLFFMQENSIDGGIYKLIEQYYGKGVGIIKENNIRSLSQERVVRLFMELVQVDSVSREEREMVDRLEGIFEKLGFTSREDGVASSINGNAGNLIVDIPGREDLPCLLFCAHLDRVQPGRGINPIIKNGYVISSGDTVLAGDDLIGVAAIIEALRLIKEKGMEHCPVKLIF